MSCKESAFPHASAKARQACNASPFRAPTKYISNRQRRWNHQFQWLHKCSAKCTNMYDIVRPTLMLASQQSVTCFYYQKSKPSALQKPSPDLLSPYKLDFLLPPLVVPALVRHCIKLFLGFRTLITCSVMEHALSKPPNNGEMAGVLKVTWSHMAKFGRWELLSSFVQVDEI